MEKKFNIGDRVMCTDNGMLGVITFVDINEGKFINNGYEVRFDDGSEEWIIEDMLALSDEPPYDPKTAFLSELKGLLEKFDAHLIAHKTNIPVSVYFNGEYKPHVAIGKEVNKGCGVVITSNNIMDYDKE